MAFSINGIGTKWYGSADKRDDGSYIVTEWIVILFVPIIPLGSMRLWPQEAGGYLSHKVPWYLPHIFKGYAVTLAVFLLFKFAK